MPTILNELFRQSIDLGGLGHLDVLIPGHDLPPSVESLESKLESERILLERVTVSGTHPPPGTGWIFDKSIHHWVKRNKKGGIVEKHPGIINKGREDITPEHLASKEEHERAVQVALKKLKEVPKPTAEEKEKARVGIEKLGANKFRKKLVGNVYERRKRKQILLEEFGDGKVCPCIYCGLRIGGARTAPLEQDKILTTAQGGRYRTANLVPACTSCNKQRSDTPFSQIAKNL